LDDLENIFDLECPSVFEFDNKLLKLPVLILGEIKCMEIA
jgi:hypothetical protein